MVFLKAEYKTPKQNLANESTKMVIIGLTDTCVCYIEVESVVLWFYIIYCSENP